MDLLEWVTELYGGGNDRPTTPSSGSSRASRKGRWDAWEGQLALQGIDPHRWTLRTMINAAEAAMYQSAEDDAERRRIEAKLYAPPQAMRRPRTARATREQPQRGQLTVNDARALVAQLAAQDAQLGESVASSGIA